MKIPNGWKTKSLEELIQSLDAGVSVNSDDQPVSDDSKIGILKTSCVTTGTFNPLENKSVIESDLSRVRVPVKMDRIVLSRMNTPALVGANAYVTSSHENLFLPDRLWQLEPIPNSCNMLWLSFVLGSKRYRSKLSKLATGTSDTMKNITKSDVLSLPVVCPPLPEQKAIAELLSTWDLAIEKTERLIKAKEKRFQWLLDELITKPSKSGKWKEAKLSTLCKVTKGQQLNVEHMVEDGLYYALNGGISASGRTNDWNTPANTITISEGGNSCGFVSFNTENFWAGGHCYSLIGLEIEQVVPKYLYHYLKAHEPKIMKLRVGSGLPNIQKKDIDTFPVSFPEIENQREIAEIMDLHGIEIDSLKMITDKYKEQKRGLMQKLLTGEWRVKVEG